MTPYHRNQPVQLEDFRRLARKHLPRMVFDFIDGAAEDERTLRANREAFSKVTFEARRLVDLSQRTLTTEVCGQQLDLPVLLAPTGLARLAGRDGERAAARAASSHGTVSVVSTASSISLEDVANSTATPQWFQVYPWGDREVTLSLIHRAKKAGYHTLVITVDVPVTGARERDLYNGMTVPPRVDARTVLDVIRHPRWLAYLATSPRITFANLVDLFPHLGRGASTLAKTSESLLNPGHVWADLTWMRAAWDGPILLKGITTAADALRAADVGCDGVIVSNHGGRQLDCLPSSLELLPEIVHAVGDRVAVLIDGGFRRGSDIVKALALGARACLIGRPWLFGLAADGQRGVEGVLTQLRTEMDRTLALVGCPQAGELSDQFVRFPPEWIRDSHLAGRSKEPGSSGFDK